MAAKDGSNREKKNDKRSVYVNLTDAQAQALAQAQEGAAPHTAPTLGKKKKKKLSKVPSAGDNSLEDEEKEKPAGAQASQTMTRQKKKKAPTTRDRKPSMTEARFESSNDNSRKFQKNKKAATTRAKKARRKFEATKSRDTEDRDESKEIPDVPVVPKQIIMIPRADQAYINEKPSNNQKAFYEGYVKEMLALGIEGLFKEFNANLRSWIPGFECFTTDVFRKNMDKNRYRDIICNDNTRVVLNDGKSNDYIHANYVRPGPQLNTFICTQGPMPTTVTDFWRMCILEGVQNIVMLCECVELGKTKCEQYWPHETGKKVTFGEFTITNLNMNNEDNHVTKTTLCVEANGDAHRLMHFQWKTWPDKTVPKSNLAIFRILREVRSSKQPIVVHCSAGVGRTGTFVVVEMCLNQLLLEKPLSLTAMVRKLREQRMHSVQVDMQFLYIAIVLLEYARCLDIVTDPELIEQMSKFQDIFDQLVKLRGPDKAPTGKKTTNKQHATPAANAAASAPANGQAPGWSEGQVGGSFPAGKRGSNRTKNATSAPIATIAPPPPSTQQPIAVSPLDAPCPYQCGATGGGPARDNDPAPMTAAPAQLQIQQPKPPSLTPRAMMGSTPADFRDFVVGGAFPTTMEPGGGGGGGGGGNGNGWGATTVGGAFPPMKGAH